MPDHFIAFWNVENLFAPHNHPHRPEWLQKKVGGDLKGWSQALYTTKLKQLATIVAEMNGGAGPDILGVCEVEDTHVLKDLATEVKAKSGRTYKVIHKDSPREKRGVDTAFLYDGSKFTAPAATVFTHFVMRRTGTRDILQATFTSKDGNDLIVMANHWPSRSGGTIESAGFRATAGETLAYFHERIREVVGTDTPVLALGDMNDDPWDGSLQYNANAWRERGDVERGTSARLYNLSWEYGGWEALNHKGKKRMLDGTLYFRGNGHLFDQILVNRALLKKSVSAYQLVDGSAGVLPNPRMVSHRTAEGPRRFGLPRGKASNVDKTGFSDHFPVGCVIREKA